MPLIARWVECHPYAHAVDGTIIILHCISFDARPVFRRCINWQNFVKNLRSFIHLTPSPFFRVRYKQFYFCRYGIDVPISFLQLWFFCFFFENQLNAAFKFRSEKFIASSVRSSKKFFLIGEQVLNKKFSIFKISKRVQRHGINLKNPNYLIVSFFLDQSGALSPLKLPINTFFQG